jgi:hypothetical protein
MTVVWDGTTYAEFNLNGLGTTYPTPSVYRLHTDLSNYDTTSRDFIRVAKSKSGVEHAVPVSDVGRQHHWVGVGTLSD